MKTKKTRPFFITRHYHSKIPLFGFVLPYFGPEAFDGVGAGCPDRLRTDGHQRQDEVMVLHTFPHVDRKDLGLIESEIFFSDISQLVADDDGGQDEPDGTGGARW